MIVKIRSHKTPSFQKVLNYMVHNKDRLFDKDKRSFVVTHNLKGDGVIKWTQQFKDNETHRRMKRTDSVLLTHEILSWHKDDAKYLTLEKMEAMAREYIRLRNPNGIYVAVPHFDKDHFHLHVCASGIEYKTGKSLRLAKADLQQLKIKLQNYHKEKYPELSSSIVEHGKKEKPTLTEKEYQLKLRTGRETEKEKLMGVLKTCYKKAISRETFFELLQECGLDTYERGGKVYGVVSGERKFRFNTLGYTEERLNELEGFKTRAQVINELRERESLNPPRQFALNNEINDDRRDDSTLHTDRQNELQETRRRRNYNSVDLPNDYS